MSYQRRVYIPLEYVFTLPNLIWQDDIVKDIAFTFRTATAKSKKTKFGVIALTSSDNTLVAIDVVDTQESWFVADKDGNIQIKEGTEQIRYLDDKFWVSRDAKGCLRVWAHGATCSTLALTVGYPGEKGINRVMQFIESKSMTLTDVISELDKLIFDPWWKTKMTWEDDNGEEFIAASIAVDLSESQILEVCSHYQSLGYRATEFERIAAQTFGYSTKEPYYNFKLYQL